MIKAFHCIFQNIMTLQPGCLGSPVPRCDPVVQDHHPRPTPGSKHLLVVSWTHRMLSDTSALRWSV